MGDTTLKLENIFLSFGGVKALADVSFAVKKGEILAVIGPNGAGKTSVVNCINGFYHPQKGQIYFESQQVVGMPPHKIAHLGIGRTFQKPALYTGMTTLDNLLAARHVRMKYGLLASSFYLGRAHKAEIEHRGPVEEIIDFLGLEMIRKKEVGTLPYGLRKRVDLGRALALEPSVLLLDEPMAGMTVEEKEDMARFIIDIHDKKGTTILIIEHDMGLVMDIADRIVVLEFGQKIAEGSPKEIMANTRVIDAYLGSEVSPGETTGQESAGG
jgi:branched-chain amino acid transport system ATP-binding protein